MSDVEACPMKCARLNLLFGAIHAYRQGQLGDVAAYKSAILGTQAYPDIKSQLTDLDHCFLHIDLNHLSTLPPGSFGKAYAQHLSSHHLTPLHVSPQVASSLQHYALGLRYMLTHDIFHVLLGYDTSLKGELAVWAFVAEQQYSPSYQKAAKWASILYPCLQPHHSQQFRAIATESRARARRAVCLIIQPFEKYWSEPLVDVQAQFGLLDRAHDHAL